MSLKMANVHLKMQATENTSQQKLIMPYGLIRRSPVAFKSRHEKTCFLQMRKQRRGNRAADQRFWFRCIVKAR